MRCTTAEIGIKQAPGTCRPRTLRLWSLMLLVGLSAVLHGDGSGAETSGPAVPGPRERCPLCGLMVAGYPNCRAQLRFADSKVVFFDGVKDLMKYYFQISKYEKKRKAGDIREIFVTDYYSTDPIGAATAWFVIGSDVLGPKGRELIPHRSQELAEQFSKDHDGRRILTFQEITPELVGGL